MENNKNKKLAVVGLIILGVIICILAFFVVKSYIVPEKVIIQSPTEFDPNAQVGQLTGKTREEIQAELNKIVEQTSLNIQINTEVEFEDGKSEGDFRIENSPANHYNMQVDVCLADTDELVYRTGLLEVNSHIEKGKLLVDLDPGVYDAIAKFTAYVPETDTKAGQVNAEIKLIVKK